MSRGRRPTLRHCGDVLYAALPNDLLIGPRYVVPGLELILFVPLVLANRLFVSAWLGRGWVGA